MSEFLTYIAYYFAGLALNLTPCVYPMLSVTVALLGKQEEGSKLSNRILKSSVYVLGMATMYSSLGVIAALTGGFFGDWLSHRWVLLGIGILIFALSLSLFGVYQLQVPTGILSKLNQKRGVGLLGIFLAGLFVGIFAAPCIGPPVAALLALVGTIQDPWYGFFSFFILSLGLGTPYWFLGVFSNLLSKLPKSGMWLVWVERLFGILLLGTAFYFFTLAFFSKYIFWVVPMTLVLGGLYLGFVNKNGNEIRLFQRSKWIVGIIALVLGGTLIVQELNKPQSLDWEPYSGATFSIYKEKGEPIMVDFFADWCAPCHEMDRYTFSNQEVIRKLEPFKKLRVDVTLVDSPSSKESLSRFNVTGVPTLIFYNSKGEEVSEARTIGFLPPDPFLEKIKSALES